MIPKQCLRKQYPNYIFIPQTNNIFIDETGATVFKLSTEKFM